MAPVHLAVVRGQQGDYPAAKTILREALDIQVKVRGAGPPRRGVDALQLGHHAPRVRRLLRDAAGPDNPRTRDATGRLASHYLVRGDSARAASCFRP